MHRRHLVWNTTSFRWIDKIVFLHSAPFRRTLNTLLLNILILAWTLKLVVLRTGFSSAKAWLAFLMLVLVFWSQWPVVVTMVLYERVIIVPLFPVPGTTSLSQMSWGCVEEAVAIPVLLLSASLHTNCRPLMRYRSSAS